MAIYEERLAWELRQAAQRVRERSTSGISREQYEDLLREELLRARLDARTHVVQKERQRYLDAAAARGRLRPTSTSRALFHGELGIERWLNLAISRHPFQQTRRNWWDTVLSATPASRCDVESAIYGAYSRRRSPRIVWFDSPLALAHAAAEAGCPDDSERRVWRRKLTVHKEARRFVARRAGVVDYDEYGTQRLISEKLGWSDLDPRDPALALQVVWEQVRDVAGEEPWKALRGSVWDEWTDWDFNFSRQVLNQTTYVRDLETVFYFREHWGMRLRSPAGNLLFALATGSGGFSVRDGLVLLSERPSLLTRDADGLLHAENRPAVAWPDGFEIYAWHGVPVPAHVIEDPDSLTPSEVVSEPNVEVRRAMIERIGYERVLNREWARQLHVDDVGVLWEIALADEREPIRVVEVENATREADGSRKRYVLRVPPTMRSAREAVAWTFGFEADDYRPLAES